MSFESFTTATNSAPLHKVAVDGSITISGRKYYADELIHYIGQHVKAFIDLEGADAVCFTLFDNAFICNAQNPGLWAAMVAGV